DLALQLPAPRRDPVDPRDDAELPAAEVVGLEGAAPPIRRERLALHWRLPPAAAAGRPVADGCGEDLVPVADDRRPDVDLRVDGALDRVPTGVDRRPDVLDLDPGRELRRQRHVQIMPTSPPNDGQDAVREGA